MITMKMNKTKTAIFIPLILLVVGMGITMTIELKMNTANGAVNKGDTVAIVIDKSYFFANTTLLQYYYTVVYSNTLIPSSTNTIIVTFLVNQTLPCTPSAFTNTVISDVQTHVSKLPFVIPQPSNANIITPP